MISTTIMPFLAALLLKKMSCVLLLFLVPFLRVVLFMALFLEWWWCWSCFLSGGGAEVVSWVVVVVVGFFLRWGVLFLALLVVTLFLGQVAAWVSRLLEIDVRQNKYNHASYLALPKTLWNWNLQAILREQFSRWIMHQDVIAAVCRHRIFLGQTPWSSLLDIWSFGGGRYCASLDFLRFFFFFFFFFFFPFFLFWFSFPWYLLLLLKYYDRHLALIIWYCHV